MGLELAHDTAKTPAQFVGVYPALVVILTLVNKLLKPFNEKNTGRLPAGSEILFLFLFCRLCQSPKPKRKAKMFRFKLQY